MTSSRPRTGHTNSGCETRAARRSRSARASRTVVTTCTSRSLVAGIQVAERARTEQPGAHEPVTQRIKSAAKPARRGSSRCPRAARRHPRAPPGATEAHQPATATTPPRRQTAPIQKPTHGRDRVPSRSLITRRAPAHPSRAKRNSAPEALECSWQAMEQRAGPCQRAEPQFPVAWIRPVSASLLPLHGCRSRSGPDRTWRTPRRRGCSRVVRSPGISRGSRSARRSRTLLAPRIR